MKYEENSVLELKEQINTDFKKEIIAFANTDGGATQMVEKSMWVWPGTALLLA